VIRFAYNRLYNLASGRYNTSGPINIEACTREKSTGTIAYIWINRTPVDAKPLLLILFVALPLLTRSQSVAEIKAAGDADSLYVRAFVKPNDARIFYGGQGNQMVLGSFRDGSPDLTRNIYHNTNDFIGLGLTYKWIDGDLYFSLPGTTYLKEERSNLDQFRLSASHTRRKMAYRGYLSESKGVIVSGNNDEYQSEPAIHDFQMGVQATYISNDHRYSYRAALFQSERQTKTAGSFLLRLELFYRSLGSSGQPIVPESFDGTSRFGSQAGLTYVRAPGFLLMPGYGANFVFGETNLFVSPVLLAGAGAAFNNYKSDSGHGTHFNLEYNANFLLNAGYNGGVLYSRLQFTYSIAYSPIQPAYLTSKNLTLSLLLGLRFHDIAKWKTIARN
jgi:hypothetical protein